MSSSPSMISAFHAHSILEFPPKERIKIDSVLAYADRLLLGLNNGSLRVYQVSDTNDSLTPLRTIDRFARRSIEALAFIKEASILISLSESTVSIHDLDSLTLQQTLTKAKGASTFAVTTNIERDESTGIPSIVSRLAIAVKRKILFVGWHDEEFAEGKEVLLQGNVRSLTWVNGRKVVAGLNAGFVMVDVGDGTVSEIVPPSVPGIAGATEEVKGWGAMGMSMVGMGGWGSKPLSTKLKGEEIVLVKDANTMYISASGLPSPNRQPIAWTSQPDALGYFYPYLVSLHQSKSHLEIRNPATQTLIQTIPLASPTVLHVPAPNVALVHGGKLFYVASQSQVWKMDTVDYETQVNDLVNSGYLDEAISLLEQLESVLMDTKDERLREVKILKGETLFREKKYREAMELFGDVSASPERVIRNFPPSIAGELATVDDASTGNATPDQEPEPEAAKPLEDKPNEAPAEPAKEEDAKADPAKPTTTATESEPETTPQRSVLAGMDLKRATNELCLYLGNARLKVTKQLEAIKNASSADLPMPPMSPMTTSSNKDAFDSNFANLNASTESIETRLEKLYETAKLVDTTLFLAYILVKPGLVGPLVRRPNHCDPVIVGKRLREEGKYNDLVDFFGGKNLHHEALSLLRQFGEAEKEDEKAPNLHGPDRTIQYLQQLDASNIDLLLEFATWVLKSDPVHGMEIFLADTEKAESLPRSRILDFLQGLDARLAIQYLEHLIDNLDDTTSEFHSRLAKLYLSHISQTHWTDDAEKEVWKEKLLNFLKTSKQYRAESVLAWLPADSPDFYESRAVVLSHMGRHRQALEIYVFKLKDHVKAEAYCNAVSANEAPIPTRTSTKLAKSSVYHTLLALYLTPPASYAPQLQPALDLLSRHGARLDASEALALIPESTKIRELENYFNRRMRAANSRVSEMMIKASLCAFETVRVQEELMEVRAREVVVAETRACPVCYKRLGKSVISRLPDGRVVHYGCGPGKMVRAMSGQGV